VQLKIESDSELRR